MIPVSIITREEAEKLGLTNKEGITEEKGHGVAAAGCMVKRKIDKSEPEIILEKTIIRQNGKKELIFMHEDRKKEMLEKKELTGYLNQFDKIEGIDKDTFLKQNNLSLEK